MAIKNNHYALLMIAAIMILSSCNMKRKADLIIHNGVIYTVNSNFDVEEAMAIREGEVLAVGSSKTILAGFQSATVVDLQGKPVYPGFIDAHCHFFGYGSDLVKCNLYGTKSFEEIIEKLKAYAPTNPFEWILGRGWDQNDWADKEFPDNSMLDSLFPSTPVYLMRIDGHAVLCNSEALKRAGITSQTKVQGGEVVLRENKMTGLLIDNAIDLVKKVIPSFTKEIYEQGLLQAQANCFAVGLTSVSDAGLGKDSIELIDHLQKNHKLKMRVYAMLSTDETTLKEYFSDGTYKTDYLNVRAVKVYIDGALGSRGALLKKPYSDKPSANGFLLQDIKMLEDLAEQCLDNGFQMCCHAIGDSAVSLVLDLYTSQLGFDNTKRWRIEHCQVVDPKDRKYFGSHKIIPSVQPTHATSDMYWAESRLGPERIKNAYAYKDLLQANGEVIALGTDFPVEDINPINTFYAAVFRKDHAGFPEDGFQKDNRIKKKDALRAMTLWAAYANFEEKEKGSLEEGKFADFVILDRDIMKVDEMEILSTAVEATYIDGKPVYLKNTK